MDTNQLNKAQEIIKSIRNSQTTNTAKLENLDTKVNDLNVALRSVQEHTSKPIVIEGEESELRQFIKSDGSLQLLTEKKSISVPNHGLVNITQKGILDSDKNSGEWQTELKEICRTRTMAKMLCNYTPKSDAKLIHHLSKAPSFLKDSIKKSLYDGAGNGGEFVPDEFREQLWTEYMQPRSLADQFETIQVDRPTVLIPRLNYGGRPFKRGQVTSDTVNGNAYNASTPQSAQASITVGGFATRYRVDQDLIEDSALQMIPMLSKQIGQDLTDAYEDCMINGDARLAGVCQDPDRANWNIRSRWGGGTFVDASDHRIVFDGFRREATLRANAFSGVINNAALTDAKILEMINKLGELGTSDGLMFVTSPEYFIKEWLGLTAVKTVDQYGPAATILTGELGSIFGVPIVLSRFMDIQLNNNGEYDGITTTKSGVLCINRSSYKHFQKSGVVIETAKEISSGAVEIVSTLRRTLASPDQATAKNVGFFTDTVAI